MVSWRSSYLWACNPKADGAAMIGLPCSLQWGDDDMGMGCSPLSPPFSGVHATRMWLSADERAGAVQPYVMHGNRRNRFMVCGRVYTCCAAASMAKGRDGVNRQWLACEFSRALTSDRSCEKIAPVSLSAGQASNAVVAGYFPVPI